jgi:tetratricopeptide (TPR) repeat protein
MRAVGFGPAILAALAVAGPATAVESYDSCIGLVAREAARAEREAAAWAAAGGGAAARHCRALALIAIGAEARAIDELLGIAAEEPGLPAQARADVLVQAGEMLLDEGDSATARAVADQALELVPADRGATGLSAAARLSDGDAAGALRELDRALAGGEATVRLLVLRSAAQRRLGDFVAARDDARHATELAPDSASAWLERGRVAARIGDREDARDAFFRAIDLDRGGTLGAAAQNALQRMEVGITQ